MNEHDLELVNLPVEEVKFIVDIQFHDAIGTSSDDPDDGGEAVPFMVVRWCTFDQISNEENEEVQVEAFLLPPEHWMSALSAEMLLYASSKFGKEREEVNDE